MEVLSELLATHPEGETLHVDAVALCLTHGLHDGALSVFDWYRKQTGEELRSDFTRGELLAYRAGAGEHEALPGGRKVFRRVGLFQRGRQSGLWMLPFRRALRSVGGILNPPREIVISPDGFTVQTWGRRRHHTWSDFRDAWIEDRELRTHHERYRHRVLVLDAPPHTYLIDVSANRPDFHGNAELLRELEARLPLRSG